MRLQILLLATMVTIGCSGNETGNTPDLPEVKARPIATSPEAPDPPKPQFRKELFDKVHRKSLESLTKVISGVSMWLR